MSSKLNEDVISQISSLVTTTTKETVDRHEEIQPVERNEMPHGTFLSMILFIREHRFRSISWQAISVQLWEKPHFLLLTTYSAFYVKKDSQTCCNVSLVSSLTTLVSFLTSSAVIRPDPSCSWLKTPNLPESRAFSTQRLDPPHLEYEFTLNIFLLFMFFSLATLIWLPSEFGSIFRMFHEVSHFQSRFHFKLACSSQLITRRFQRVGIAIEDSSILHCHISPTSVSNLEKYTSSIYLSCWYYCI